MHLQISYGKEIRTQKPKHLRYLKCLSCICWTSSKCYCYYLRHL